MSPIDGGDDTSLPQSMCLAAALIVVVVFYNDIDALLLVEGAVLII